MQGRLLQSLAPSQAQFRQGDALLVWITTPFGLVTQLAPDTHLDKDMAELLAGPVHKRVLELIETEGPVSVVHDWTGLVSYDNDARRVLIDWGLSLGPKRVKRIDILLSPDSSAFVKMAARVGSAALNVAGHSVEVHFDPLKLADFRTKPFRPHPKVTPRL